MLSRVKLKIGNIDAMYNSLDTKLDVLSVSNELLEKLSLTNLKNTLVDIVPQCACGSTKD